MSFNSMLWRQLGDREPDQFFDELSSSLNVEWNSKFFQIFIDLRVHHSEGISLEQHALDTNAGKQRSYAATAV